MSRKALDLTGHKFGRLTATEFAGKMGLHRYWFLECECGNLALERTGHLNAGLRTSCGCREGVNLKHGGTRNAERTVEFTAWMNLRNSNYVGHVEEWEDFQQFFKDVGWRPSSEHVIGRKDRSEPHGPNNTYWKNVNDETEHRTNLRVEVMGPEFTVNLASIRTLALTRETTTAGARTT